ncbi:MFS transporter [Oceanobacillus caeni]|uniref:MFS transporter n=1 Tax=Oceanobacillus caeni TaxID=405946 RepID=UPI001C233A52|nr:MFS transporter [Oceanobacillus caeni]MBU8790267.1 MFS transporter [Oceanobacillus caeni]
MGNAVRQKEVGTDRLPDNLLKKGKKMKVRWFILFLICLVTAINYIDRAIISLAAPAIQSDLQIDAAAMGIVFSAFGWSYTVAILFSGYFLDKFGPRRVYAYSLIIWSAFTFLIGTAKNVGTLLIYRLGLGAGESPSIPTNAWCVAEWFPKKERATAVGFYTGTQYIGLAFMTPVITWIIVTFNWKVLFYGAGIVGFLIAAIWHIFYRNPKEHKKLSKEEKDYIVNGGGMIGSEDQQPFSWKRIGQLLKHRQIWGMFIGQYSIMTTMFFFMTWFPTYLIQEKGLTMLETGWYASIPYIVAILGTLLGGKFSDWMLDRGVSTGTARKLPIIIGLLLSCSILGGNFTNSANLVIVFMSIAFLGQGIASTVTGALLSDIAPKGMVGITSSSLYFVANVGGALSPLIVGFIVNSTGSFTPALAFVSGVALIATFAYIFVIGKVKRIELPES